MLKVQAEEERQRKLPKHLRSCSSGETQEQGSPTPKEKASEHESSIKNGSSMKNGSAKNSSVKSENQSRNQKKGSVDLHQQQRMTTNKKKLMKKIMNEFRDRDSVMGPQTSPFAAPSAQTQESGHHQQI